MKRSFAVVLFCFSQLLNAQSLPENYFEDPLKVPLALAGSFAELRSNHFHSGLDIKTQQREGLPVYASADGFVSRIKVSNYGYGKALYIQHPNGYTTVYAHLKKFSPDIEAYVKEHQYQKESYEVELFPSAEELRVQQGELVASSGNTGGSGGPHLHFEIRDSSQHPMNPLMFGIDIKDTRAPLVKGLYVYPMGEEAHVNGSTERVKIQLIPQADGSYISSKVEACGPIGFGINTVDQMDAAPNHNGVFRIETFENGEKVFQANFEEFSFAETRHLNKLIDYEHYKENNARIQKLFIEPSNPLSIYSQLPSNGLVNVKDSLSYEYKIRVSDFSGNERLIRIPIIGEQRSQLEQVESPVTEYLALAQQDNHFENAGISIDIPANTLYEDVYLNLEFEEDKIKIHKDVIPLKDYFSIRFDVSKFSPEEREDMFVAELNKWGNPSYVSTDKNGTSFQASTRNFGTYTLARDSVSPRVTPVNFRDGQWISGNETLQVRISDDLSGISSFRASVNGKWILMEYEYKKNLLTHDFSDAVVTDTENHLIIEVTDNVGNTTVMEKTFYRKAG